MIYPEPIQHYVVHSHELEERFGRHVFPRDVNKTVWPLSPHDGVFDQWLLEEGYRENVEVRNYIDFLRDMRDKFEHVRRNLTYRNPDSTHRQGDDLWATGWAGEGMLPIAAYLYYLHSHGVPGNVLECGCFKGGSTCCLSWVCHRLGRKLIAADSFEGLPESDGYYGKGDFLGCLDEVRKNVEEFGRIGSVEFIKGFYAESLKGFNENLMLIWLDVDLGRSVLDALAFTFPKLQKGGVLFSDGLGERRDFDGQRLKPAAGESAGICDYFARNGILHKAKYAGWGWMGLVVPHCRDTESLLFDPAKLKRLIRRREPSAIPCRMEAVPQSVPCEL
jgi:hypothetical protein